MLHWGGLRGAISLALALSLPAALGPQAGMLRVMAFGVALFTLLVQGTTVRPLLRLLGIKRGEPRTARALHRSRLIALHEASRSSDAWP